MSYKRVFKWMCDTCAEVQEMNTYGLPKGWVWLAKGGHACEKCSGQFTDREKGRSGVFKTLHNEQQEEKDHLRDTAKVMNSQKPDMKGKTNP